MPNSNKRVFFLWYNLVPHLWYTFMHNIIVAIAMIIKTRILFRADLSDQGNISFIVLTLIFHSNSTVKAGVCAQSLVALRKMHSSCS